MKKVAVLIAAGTGMGADAAKILAKNKFKVAILSSSGKGERLAKKLNGIGLTGSNLNTIDIKNLVDVVIKKWGRIDVLLEQLK